VRCYVLAGGRSRRFGTDKLFYRLGNETVLERVVKVARQVFPEVILVAKEEEKFKPLGLPVLLDGLPVQASLVGLYAALRHAEGPAFVLSGDLPLIKKELLELLLKRADEPATVAETDRLHPLVGVYYPSALPEVERAVKEGDYRLTELLRRLGAKRVRVPKELSRSLLNLNRPEDLKLINGGGP